MPEPTARHGDPSPIAPRLVDAFYRTAHLGLRELDARGGPKHFDADADARWRLFRGHLDETDRLDLLVRDAAVAHPAAFAARDVFDLEGLADDEPFGHRWRGPEPLTADELRRAGATAQPRELRDVLVRAADLWGLDPTPPGALPDLQPASRVLAAGTGALITLADLIGQRPGFDLAEQVALVTERPGERQIFGLAAALLGSFHDICFIGPDATADQLRGVGRTRFDYVVTSLDAAPTARQAAEQLGRELGAT